MIYINIVTIKKGVDRENRSTPFPLLYREKWKYSLDNLRRAHHGTETRGISPAGTILVGEKAPAGGGKVACVESAVLAAELGEGISRSDTCLIHSLGHLFLMQR